MANKLFSLTRSNDYDILSYLDRECFPTDFPQDFKNKKTFSWILWDQKKPIGFCSIKLLGFGIAYLCRGAITKNYRGKNLQKKLIKSRIRFAKKNNLTTLITYTTKENLASANNLIACGFKLYWPEYCWAGKDMIYLKLDL